MDETDSAPDVRVSLLGGFSVTVDGEPVADRWRLRKAKTLVKLLALTPGHRLHRDVVIDTFWPEAEPRAAANNLHQVLHYVRSVTGGSSIALHDDVVLLCSGGGLTVDVELFEEAVANALKGRDIAELRRALDIWTGPLLPEDEYADWAIELRGRLADLHATLATALGSRLLEQGELPAALALLEPLAASRPVDEQLHRVLFEVLAGLGRRWEAISGYERLRAALDDTYAAEPGPETRATYRRLLTGSRPMPAAVRHNLPTPTTSFVGRSRLLSDLSAYLERTRLLSLTGVGGVGKSRVALELARRLGVSPEYPDGVWLVELAGIQDPEAIASAAASALALTLPSGRTGPAALAERLSGRSLLLVIDNCEHLLDACGAQVEELLGRCPNVRIITTSREPLGIAGELVYRVPSLELPSMSGLDAHKVARLEAAQLFVERARLSAPSFELNSQTAGPVVEVCHRLDGIPLALELAAARLAHFTVADLAERLDDSLALLSTKRGQLNRQQTLTATLDWSHGLLKPAEQRAFRRLAVFAGGFTIAAATTVCEGTVLETTELVSRLVDKSLVNADTAGARTRYQLLEVVRQYAEAQLIEADDVAGCRLRHLNWCVEAAAEHDPDRPGATVGEPSGWFDLEQDNLRTALSTALATQPRLCLHLATVSWRFWLSRGLISEGARWLRLALDADKEPCPLRGRALAALSVVLIRQARTTALPAVSEEIVDLAKRFGTPDEHAHALHHQALMTFMAGNWDLAQAQVDTALRVSEPFPSVTASVQHFAGILAMWRGDMAAARQRFAAAAEQLESVPDEIPPFFIAMSLGWVVDERTDPPIPIAEETIVFGPRITARQARGHVQLAVALIERLGGRTEVALDVIDDALAGFRAAGDDLGAAYALAQQGHTLRWAQRYQEADDCLLESEILRRNLSDQRGMALSLSGRAVTAAAAGAQDEARTLCREAVALMDRSSDTPGLMVTTVNRAIVELLSTDLSAAQTWLRRGIQLFPVPGAQGALGWLHLLRAHVLGRLGDRNGSTGSLVAAGDAFARVGARPGLDVVKRVRKAGLATVHT